MEIRHLRYFSAVAEHGSIAEAAKHLNIVQPALSRQIRNLEEELGAALFRRDARGVVLTAAGRQFLGDTHLILSECTGAKERVLRVAHGEIGALRIGMEPIYTCHPAVLDTLRRYRTSRAEVSLSFEPLGAVHAGEALHTLALDGGFLAWRDRRDEQLDATLAFQSPVLLAVHRSSVWAQRAPVRLHALDQETCVSFARDSGPGYFDFLDRLCTEADFSPKLAPIAADLSMVLGLVAAGIGYAIVPQAARFNCPADVVLHSHPDLRASFDVEFVWRRKSMTPALRHFVELVTACYAANAGSPKDRLTASRPGAPARPYLHTASVA